MTSTDTRTAQPDGTATDAPHPSGPMARIVLASISTGVVGAALLTLGVFAGGREHSITGGAPAPAPAPA